MVDKNAGAIASLETVCSDEYDESSNSKKINDTRIIVIFIIFGSWPTAITAFFLRMK